MTDIPRGRSSQDGLARLVHENLRALLAHRTKLEGQKSVHERLADRISRRAGSMYFAYGHGIAFGFWLIWNSIPGLPHWDPYPFVMLAMVASVEAIFLSTFVLVSQNRMQRLADRRADLDVQVNLLSEREITRVLAIVSAIARRLEVTETPADSSDLERDVHPQELLEEIDSAQAIDDEDARSRTSRGQTHRIRIR